MFITCWTLESSRPVAELLSLGIITLMTPRTKFWLKVGATLLIIAVEVFTFRHSVIAAFAQPSVSATVIAISSQLSFVLGLAGLWNRTRVAQQAGCGSLFMFTLIVSLA